MTGSASGSNSASGSQATGSSGDSDKSSGAARSLAVSGSLAAAGLAAVAALERLMLSTHGHLAKAASGEEFFPRFHLRDPVFEAERGPTAA